MAHGHPTDEMGRVLPASDWPADRAAPEDLDVIRRFCNTRNRESGADRFETAEGIHRWLDHEGISPDVPDPSDRRRIVAFREHLHAHALAHRGGRAVDGLDAALAEHVAGVGLTMTMHHGDLDVVPARLGPANDTIGTIAVAVMRARRSGRWSRFKACDGCEWVFYDRSRNDAGRWCSMSACGGRAKVAAFRARERGTAP